MTRRPAQTLRPWRATVPRLLYLLGGSITLVNGVIELGPDARPAVQATGWPLVAAGLAALVLVVLLRTPRRWLPAAAVVVSLLMVGARLLQYSVLGSPALLLTCVLPLLAGWQLLRADGRAWARTPAQVWRQQEAQRSEGRARRSLPGRLVASAGAMGLVTCGLVVIGGAGVVAATAPCDLPPPAARSGLVTKAGSSDGTTKPSGTVRATDGTALAYYAYVPPRPVASLVFYPGSGAGATNGYLPIGTTLQQQGVAVYLFDLRGHGASGGPRGDTPSSTQLQQDVATAFAFVAQQQPGRPEFVGGHSAGAGVVLNSAHLLQGRAAGYAFLAPDFGLHSGTELQDDASNFATICQRPLVAATLTNGLLGAHTDAVAFAYTAQQVRAGLVPRYTAAMAIAQNADDSAQVLAHLDAPVGVWVGSDDEVFSAAAVVRYAQQHAGPGVTAVVQPGLTHLGILDDSGPVGAWILQQTES